MVFKIEFLVGIPVSNLIKKKHTHTLTVKPKMPMTSATAMMHKTIGIRFLILRFVGCVTPECLAGKLLTALVGVINGLSVSAVIIGYVSDTECN